jgi:D-glycero-D-manno-heptose 1,7-bisphosphate phosphatase
MKEAGLLERFADPRLGDDLLWREVRIPRSSRPAPALFLDRDGVIIEERGYISSPQDVALLPGISQLIREARTLGMTVVEITNQAGIARGYFGWFDFLQVENRVTQALAEQGVAIDAVFACPFHPEGQDPYRAACHPWRKPNPGMLLEAASLLNLALSKSVVVGDKSMDLQAASAANLALGIHVLTGHGREHEGASSAISSSDFPVHIVQNASQAAALLREVARLAN